MALFFRCSWCSSFVARGALLSLLVVLFFVSFRGRDRGLKKEGNWEELGALATAPGTYCTIKRRPRTSTRSQARDQERLCKEPDVEDARLSALARRRLPKPGFRCEEQCRVLVVQ